MKFDFIVPQVMAEEKSKSGVVEEETQGGEDKKTKKCEECDSPGVLPCSKCFKTFYCGPKHATRHRRTKSHLEECYPARKVKVECDGGRGRSWTLETTKEVGMGEIILKELPLFIGPGSYEYSSIHHSHPKLPLLPICLGCYQLLPRLSTQLCTNCKWPMHNACQNEPWHKDFECDVLAKGRVGYSGTEPTQYYHITLLRLLLLPIVLPSVWTKLTPMIQIFAEEMEKELGIGTMDSLAEAVQYKLNLSFEINGVVLGGIYKLLQFKGIYHVMPEDVSCTCIFERMSEIEHSCIPNTRYTLIPYKQGQPFQILLYATHHIPTGTRLTRTLISEVTMQETFVRREKLSIMCGYICNCPRCVDGTELNSFISAVRCPSFSCLATSGRYLLPESPTTGTSLGTVWKCSDCNYSTSYELLQGYVDGEIKRIISRRFRVAPSRRIQRGEGSDGGVVGLDPDLHVYELILDGIEMILSQSKLILHPNHYILWPIKDAYMNLIAETLDDMPMKLKIHFSERLLLFARSIMSVVVVLSPGISPITGRLLYYLAKGLQTLIHTLRSGDLKDEEGESIRGVLDRLYGDSYSMLSLIKRFPQAHGIPMVKEMMEELEQGMEQLKFDGIQQLFNNTSTP